MCYDSISSNNNIISYFYFSEDYGTCTNIAIITNMRSPLTAFSSKHSICLYNTTPTNNTFIVDNNPQTIMCQPGSFTENNRWRYRTPTQQPCKNKDNPWKNRYFLFV